MREKMRVKTVMSSRYSHGIALVLVLWVITLLTVMASSFVFSMRTDTLLVRNLMQSARAQALADAGVYRAIYALLEMTPGEESVRWQQDGRIHLWKFEDENAIRIQLLDISGKIDINSASEILLKGLFQSVGLSEEQATQLLEATLDWRDADNKRRLNGAEEKEYAAVGLKYTPANAPFEVVDELKRVLGMSPELYEQLEDVITVDSGQVGVNAGIASRKVLRAFPGATDELVDDYVAQRLQARLNNISPPLFYPAVSLSRIAPSGGSVYSVRVDAELSSGAVFVREAVVKINQAAVPRFTFRSWSEGIRPGQEMAEIDL